MKRHKIVLDPVSNRRLICLLALTAGICFAVFVEISRSDAPQFTDTTAPPPLFSFSMYNISFSGQPAALHGPGASITAPLSHNAIFDDYGAWIPAGSSFSIFSIQLFVISLLTWLHGSSNCLWVFWRNRFQSRSASSANNVERSSRTTGLNFNTLDPDLLAQPVPFSKCRASKPSPIMDDVLVTINTGASQSTTTSEETQKIRPSE